MPENTPEDAYAEYVWKYARQHGITFEEAEQHAIVKEVKKSYEEGERPTRMAGWSEERRINHACDT